jgi:hypothetical protein
VLSIASTYSAGNPAAIALAANDYLKFYWWSQATGMKLLATAAGTSPTRPLSPSVNVSIFNVG